MELAFLAAIVSAFTFVWLVIHCIAEYRWPQSPSPQTNNAYIAKAHRLHTRSV
jgi:hypothetical protein